MSIELEDLLDGLHDRTGEKFKRQPDVIARDGSLDVAKLPIDAPTWHRVSDVVAVFFDLKSSTNLERGRSPSSTASIYDAGVGGVVKIFHALAADFVDIQGDGGFGLFWGDFRYERAMCTAITIRTFSEDFTTQLMNKWPEAPSTGFKVGVASGPILAKRIGVARHLNLQEPVWAGRPVNYAAKAAQQTDPARILVTGSVWDAVEGNDYLTFSCGCLSGVQGVGTPTLLWEAFEIEKIPDDERFGKLLKSSWCQHHGGHFLNAILNGETKRNDVRVEAKSARNLLGSGSKELIEAAKNRAAGRAAVTDLVALGVKRSESA